MSVAKVREVDVVGEWWMPSEVARINDTLAYLQSRFAKPMYEILPVKDFGASGSVATLGETFPLWGDVFDDLIFTTTLVGGHNGAFPLSMYRLFWVGSTMFLLGAPAATLAGRRSQDGCPGEGALFWSRPWSVLGLSGLRCASSSPSSIINFSSRLWGWRVYAGEDGERRFGGYSSPISRQGPYVVGAWRGLKLPCLLVAGILVGYIIFRLGKEVQQATAGVWLLREVRRE